MKRSGIILFCYVTLFTACKKEQTANPGTEQQPAAHQKMMSASHHLTEAVTVSDRGYLVLPDSNAYADYLNFLDSNSVDSIAAYHGTMGFISQASVDDQAGNYFAPSIHNAEYIFSRDGMVQIGSVLYRCVNSEGYFLAMPVSQLDDNTYNAMAAKTFLPSAMARLKVGGSYGDNLEAFVTSHIGFDGDGTTPPIPPVICGKKYTFTYSDGTTTIRDESWYFMGIRYRHIITVYTP